MSMNNQIKVTLLDFMGSDKQVVNAARASFGEESRGPITEADVSLLNYLARGFAQKEWDELANQVLWSTTNEEVQELLWKVKAASTHFAPFAHPHLSIRVEAPLAIASQLWGEESRYVDKDPECFRPDGLRKRADNIKQGSSDEFVENQDDAMSLFNYSYSAGVNTYKHLLRMGVDPEQARFVLPQGTMVSWVWTGSLVAFARVVELQSNSRAQKEAQLFAEQLSAILSKHFPYSFLALTTGNAVFTGVEVPPGYSSFFNLKDIGSPISDTYYIAKGFKFPPPVGETPVDKFIDFFKKLFLLP
jgi:thymidylate synthase (FAD)